MTDPSGKRMGCWRINSGMPNRSSARSTRSSRPDPAGFCHTDRCEYTLRTRASPGRPCCASCRTTLQSAYGEACLSRTHSVSRSKCGSSRSRAQSNQVLGGVAIRMPSGRMTKSSLSIRFERRTSTPRSSALRPCSMRTIGWSVRRTCRNCQSLAAAGPVTIADRSARQAAAHRNSNVSGDVTTRYVWRWWTMSSRAVMQRRIALGAHPSQISSVWCTAPWRAAIRAASSGDRRIIRASRFENERGT